MKISEKPARRDAGRGIGKPPLTVQCSEKAPRNASFHRIRIRQPTLVVAWIGMDRHASAHKRRPVFRRWAPALNTTAEADDRSCLIQATVVIHLNDLIM